MDSLPVSSLAHAEQDKGLVSLIVNDLSKDQQDCNFEQKIIIKK